MTQLFVISTLICLMDTFASVIIKYILTWYFQQSTEEHQIRQNLLNLKKEMNSLSVVDEFSKYAKLQRKYNKLEDEAKDKINHRSKARETLRLSLKFTIRVIKGIITSIIVFMYRREPIIVFSSNLTWPLQNLLSWPTAVDNCISLPTWIVLMQLALSSFPTISA